MAGRPFLNVALPATATAAVAVVSYFLYKKTCPADDEKRPISPIVDVNVVTIAANPSDPDPTPMPFVTPQYTPDSSLCESPPLAFNEVADTTLTQRIFDISGDEGNNNIWTLDESISDEMSSKTIGPRGDVSNITEDTLDVAPNVTISPEPTKKIETDEPKMQNDAGAVAAALMQNAHPTKMDNKGLLNLELEELQVGVYEGISKMQVEAQPNLIATNPFVMQPPAQNSGQMPLPTGAFDSATHSPSEEMLESPCVSNYSDIHSEESSDSGKGGSDINMPAVTANTTTSHSLVYEFELPQDLCGLLIGQQGSTIKFIKNKTQANIYLKRHHYNSRLKLCTITGNQSEIDSALQMIRNKFPLTKYPVVTLNQVNPQLPAYDTYLLPDTMQLILPEGIMCDVYLSSLVTANHFFVQQTVHPTYPRLSQLTADMSKCYGKAGTPAVPGSILPSAICAAPVLDGWYRAQVTHLFDDKECGVKYLDYGGYARVPISSLRKIRGDFLTIPFQASECFLANVKPVNDESGWSIEAHRVFEELAQGQILQAQVVGYTDTGIPFVYLFRRQGALTHFINRELVSRGVALWYDHQV